MAVDPQQARADLYGHVRLRDHDLRVATDDWVFYLRGVRSPAELTGLEWWHWAGLGDAVLVPLLLRGTRRWRTRGRWMVAVVRLTRVSSTRVVQARVVHDELLPRGQEPRRRLSELADAVRAGTYG